MLFALKIISWMESMIRFEIPGYFSVDSVFAHDFMNFYKIDAAFVIETAL